MSNLSRPFQRWMNPPTLALTFCYIRSGQLRLHHLLKWASRMHLSFGVGTAPGLLGLSSSKASNFVRHQLALSSLVFFLWTFTLNDESCIYSRRRLLLRRPTNNKLPKSRTCKPTALGSLSGQVFFYSCPLFLHRFYCMYRLIFLQLCGIMRNSSFYLIFRA